MRVGVWCGAAALALLTLASALRTPQVEGATRVSRRLPTPASDETEEVTTFRPRMSRRRQEILNRELSTTRSRPTTEAAVERTQSQRNDQFDSRRTYTRTRNRPVENDANKEATSRASVRSRTRPTSRRTFQPTQSPEASTSKLKESRSSDLSPRGTYRTTPRVDDTPTQFRRRGSTASTTEGVATRRRGRVNTRVDTRPLDLVVSGTTNTLIAVKEPTTSRTSAEIRDARKLRYRTRLTETDTNLTGEGITATNEVTQSSQNKENITSQPEIQTTTPAIETTSQASIEATPVKTKTILSSKIVRRPLTRGKVNFRPAVSLTTKLKKQSDEISEDDNYPESFKALIQAKNASTQTSSPASENLSVKASQKVYKTYTSSAQSTNTGPAINKYTRFRSRISTEEKSNKNETKNEGIQEALSPDATNSTEPPKLRTPEYRPRSTYHPRYRKTNLSSSIETNSSNQSSERPVYKFNRKYKPSTTEAPKIESTSKFKRLGSNSILKKSLVRPTYTGRNSTTEASEKGKSDDSKIIRIKGVLPKTSYYSRLRSKNETTTTTTTEAVPDPSVETPADKKMEDTADMPLIFSLLRKPGGKSNQSTKNEETQASKEPEREKKMFIIAVSSKESLEKSTENEVTSKMEEEDKMGNTVSSTQKYHSNYKDNVSGSGTESKDQVAYEATPPIRNIQSRKNGRKRTKPEYYEDVSEATPKSRERNFRKHSEPFSKPTEPSTNGIPPDPEKQKGRFSSKFRGSYLDKPFYKATVPTVTPSTAWLKFFVTDPQLAKSVEEPYWFEGEDIYVTTEMSRQSTTAPSYIHESSIELVEGEEIQLGPDMNAISFTKTRSTLSSADLRLTESLTKPSHTMNVEASQHSPSVTISIFDALAEILTSTPRTPRLSSTTEVNQKQNINDLQTLNGVSNSITVNSVRGLASQDTFTTTVDVNSNTKSVQTTASTSPTVINQRSVGEATTTSLNTQDGNVTPVNTPTLPSPPPTTPVSARRPFAIKVLYSDTDPPTDISTAESTRSSKQPSTDNTVTVHNTVSDLLLTNNNLVSSELTSMLSNNIRDIIQNMDEETRSKLSVDMAKLLKTLIPRALDRLKTINDDDDNFLNTTPYSLEEIKDTGNIDIENKINEDSSSLNPFQTETTFTTVNSIGTTLGVTENPTQAVNNVDLQGDLFSTQSVSSSQTTSADAVLTTALPTTIDSFSITTTSITTESPSTATSSASIDTESVNVGGEGNRLGVSLVDSTNTNVPLPFFTNFKVRDFTAADTSDVDINTSTVQSVPLPLFTKSISAPPDIVNSDLQTLSQVSPMQLWVLSKKARVLQMIEDLIRQHNTEIAAVQPLTDMLSQTNNISLSNRLTEILNTMSSTTESTDVTTDVITEGSTVPLTTSSISPFPLFTTQFTQTGSTGNFDFSGTATFSTSEASVDDFTATTAQTTSDIFSRLGLTDSDVTETPTSAENTDLTVSTSPTTAAISDAATQAEGSFTTTSDNTETTTEFINTETTTINSETTTALNIDTTVQTDVENTNAASANETKQNLISVVSDQINVANQIPKKDYVIFGILPNNTVVRKDPNEDILESLTEASPYIVYSLLPNNTVIRRFPNGTRVPRVMQRIDVLPITPWSLRNPYSPIHNNPAIVRPHNPIRVSTNIVTFTDTSNNGTENRLTNDTVNNLQTMIPTTLNIKDSSSLGVTTATYKPPAEKSTASHVLSLRTSTMLPSVDEILLNSISSAVKEEMVISSMTSSTREPRILTLDIDPETKQIRTERPGDGSEGTVFKYIPIDEVTVDPQNTNVLKLASTRAPSTQTARSSSVASVTEVTDLWRLMTQTPQILTRLQTEDPTTTVQMTAGTPIEITSEMFTNAPDITESTTSPPIATMPPTASVLTTTAAATTTTTTEATTTTLSPLTTTAQPTTAFAITTVPVVTMTSVGTNSNFEDDARLLQSLLGTERSPKSINVFSRDNQLPTTDFTTVPSTTRAATSTTQLSEEAKLLQALLAANSQSQGITIPNLSDKIITTGAQTTTSRSIEEEIRQFEEDTKLLKALLAATGQNPANLNIPSLDSLIPQRATSPVPTTTPRPTTTTTIAPPTTTTHPTTTTARPTTTQRVTTTARIQTTIQSIKEDLNKLTEDAQLLQALLQATRQNTDNVNMPVISSVTSNVRIASDPRTTSVGSNPTTPAMIRPVYTSRTRTTTTSTTPAFTNVPLFTTLQPRVTSTTEEVGISSTLPPKGRRRLPTTTVATERRAPASRFTVTTEIPSTSTFSDEEDLVFLQNLKTVLKNSPNDDDPESALANRIIALAVERSLNEIESGKQADSGRTGKTLATTPVTRPPTTTTTTTRTTTTSRPAANDNTPSIEDDIKQFQEDTKLLQALIKATGQDPSKFNIPTLPSVNTNTNVSPNIPSRASEDLKLLSNLLASPSPLNEPFDSLTEKPTTTTAQTQSTPARPFGAKIVVEDQLQSERDDAKLLKTLITLQGAQETTTQKSKLAITGQSPDEALKKLIQQTKTPGMVSEATKAPVAISTEYGKSNDALLAALLKEQGFGPTTASSLDEQLRLAALLNQVVVTPKNRRTTTPPPPPPPPRRPILDGLAWLWQQWRETGPGPTASRPNRRPASPTQSSAAQPPPRLNFFGSGPFVGNADEQPSGNRIPLEPPRVVAAEQAPGRGQLVSAAINVTRAFSQFLGAAIAGAAQTVQNVIRAGQRAAGDAYSTGSG